MSFNRIVDRRFDKANPRTADRHLPAGRSLSSALDLCILSAAGWSSSVISSTESAFSSLPSPCSSVFLFTHPSVLGFHSCFSGVALAAGAVGACSPSGSFDFFPFEAGWLALKKSAFLPLILSVAVVFWLVGSTFIYGLQDYEFDAHTACTRSSCVGPQNALTAAFLAHMVMGAAAVSDCFRGFGGIPRRNGHHPGQPVARTLVGAPAQFEMDQHGVFPAQRAHQPGFFDRDGGGGDFEGGFSCVEAVPASSLSEALCISRKPEMAVPPHRHVCLPVPKLVYSATMISSSNAANWRDLYDKVAAGERIPKPTRGGCLNRRT